MTKHYDFYPAVLEIQEAPPSPVGRSVLWLLVGFMLIALAWSIWGRIDMVAVATGKLTPSGYVKNVQSAISGMVTKVRVRTGDTVRQGDVLFTLDDTIAVSQRHQALIQMNDLQAKKLWQSVLLEHISQSKQPSAVEYPQSIPINIQERNNELMQNEWQDYYAKKQKMNSEIEALEARITEISGTIRRLSETLPLIQSRESSLADLREKKLVAEHDYLEVKRNKIDAEFDLQYQKDTLATLHKQIQAMEMASAELESQKRLELQSRQSSTLLDLSQAEELLNQQEKLVKQHLIIAPFDGKIQDVVVKSPGEVIDPNQVIARIVPVSDDIYVEAMLLNKDIGFVQVGQPVTVKVEAFDYIRYGSIDGVVEDISPDATLHEQLGYVFAVKVKLSKNSLTINEKSITLSPGMTVTAEIKTEQQRVINFFLTPVRKTVDESMSER